jgi:prepilin signal peptidase PulO-like enzyme (type II secretory pathway)
VRRMLNRWRRRREIGRAEHWYSPPSRLGGRLPQPHTNVSTAQRDVGPTTVQLPLGVGDVTTGALSAAVAVFAAATGWWITGAAVAIPLALVGGVALAAAIEDSRTGRIPNGLILTGITIVACSWGFVAVLDNRLMGPLALDVLSGLALGGAPVVFLMWLVAPRLIGGGDWKLLVVLGAVVGFLAPASASVVPVAAFGAAAAAAAAHHRRHVRLGPFLAAGYVVAIVATVVAPELFGSWYLGTAAG